MEEEYTCVDCKYYSDEFKMLNNNYGYCASLHNHRKVVRNDFKCYKINLTSILTKKQWAEIRHNISVAVKEIIPKQSEQN